MDSVSCIEFDSKTAQLQEKWNSIAPGFFPWFVQHKADYFQDQHDCLCSRGCSAWFLLHRCTQIMPMRARILFSKTGLISTRTPYPPFIAELRSFVQQSLTEAERAVYGAGEYYLSEEFKTSRGTGKK